MPKRLLLSTLLLFSFAPAERGDWFFLLGPVLDPSFNGRAPGFGGTLGLEMGVNDRTDFQINLQSAANPDIMDENGLVASQLTLHSLFTPYFGEIRPRIGGLLGLSHYLEDGGDNEILFLAGLQLQSLWTASDRVALFADISPTLGFGPFGAFFLPVRLGMRFRISD